MSRNLDVLRALAVLFVIGGHVGLSHYPNEALEIVAHMGVLLFFVHTSYVLMLSLERLSAQHKKFSRAALIFYIRRAFRIYPLAILTVYAVALLGAPYVVPAIEHSLPFLANIFLIQNLVGVPSATASLWTLPVELQMYLFLPFCFVMARKNIRLALLFGVLSLSAGFMASTYGGAALLFALYSPCFAAGILAYSLARHRSHLKKFKGTYWAIALCAIVAAAGFLLQPDGAHFIARDWATSLSVALLIPLFKDMSVSWLSKAAFQVARYSYGIYLFHPPIMVFTHDSWLGTVVLTGLLSIVAYHLIEAPMIKFGQKITGHEPTQIDTLLATPAP